MEYVSDEDLVRQYVATQQATYVEQLYRRYLERVYTHCVILTKDSQYAQDLTQDIFMHLDSKLAGFRYESRFSTWLLVIATNYCRTQVRYQQLRQERLVPISGSTLEMPLEDGVAEQEEWQARQVIEALGQLNPLDQELLLLRYRDELSVEMLANLHKLGMSAVKMRLKRSRDKFRNQYLAQVFRDTL